jgi:hypothetical protein
MAVILPEAGGRFTSLRGREGREGILDRSGLSTNGLLHEEVLESFKYEI